MSVAIIADAHLGGPGGDARPLIAQLDTLAAQGCRRLVLLGDIFHVWVGSRQFENDDICSVVAALERLRRQGIRLDYVEGNRDFFLEGSAYAELFNILGQEVAFEAGGVRYLAVHGDGLNDRDRQYLFWRWLSKSPAVRFLTLRLPGAIAHRLVHATERRLGETNFKHKIRLPEAVIRRYGARRLAEGHDILYIGHFHTPRTWHVEGGEIRILDAWFNSHHIEWIED